MQAKPPIQGESHQDAAFDPSVLEAQTAGDAELGREVLGLFLTQCSTEIVRLKAATDAEARRQSAHRIAGSARAVGAVVVGRLASSVERGDVASMGALEKAIAEARRLITDYLAE